MLSRGLSQNCPKQDSAEPSESLGCGTGRRDRATLPVWAVGAMSVISPSHSSGTLGNPYPSERSKTEGFVNRLRGSHRLSRFSWLLLGLGLYSYRVRELFVCWMFFIGVLVALGLVIIGGVLAWRGGKCAFHWARLWAPIAFPILSDPVELRLEPAPEDRRWK